MRSIGFLALSFLAGGASWAPACVGCREPGADVVAGEASTVSAGVAFSGSVIFMLGFVLLLAFGLAGYIWKTCAERERSSA